MQTSTQTFIPLDDVGGSSGVSMQPTLPIPNTIVEDRPPKRSYQIFSVAGFGGTLIGSIILWVGVFIPNSSSIFAMYLLLFEAFLIVPGALTLISSFRRTNYGITITAIVFACLNVVSTFITGCILIATFPVTQALYCSSYAYNNWGYTTMYYSEYYRNACLGNKLVVGGMIIIFVFQIVVLVMASLESRRVPKSNAQPQVIYITAPQMAPMQTFPTQFPGMPPQYVTSPQMTQPASNSPYFNQIMNSHQVA